MHSYIVNFTQSCDIAGSRIELRFKPIVWWDSSHTAYKKTLPLTAHCSLTEHLLVSQCYSACKCASRGSMSILKASRALQHACGWNELVETLHD